MSQFDFGTINPATKSGTELATDLNSWRDALLSCHRGSSAPAYITAGMTWINDAVNPWVLYLYDGADNIQIGTFNTTTNLFTVSGIGTLETTVTAIESKLDQFVTPLDFGGIGDGTNHPLSERFATLAEAQAEYPHATALTDEIDWAAAQAALNTAPPNLHLLGRHYRLNQDLTGTDDIDIYGDGNAILEFSAGKRFTIEGSLTALPALAANITPTSRSATFASAPSLVAGDVFIAYNPTDYSWSPYRSYYRAGEYFQCHSISGNVASFYGLPADTYTTAAMSMYKVNGVRVTLDGVTVKAESSTTGSAMVIRFGVGVTVNNFRGSGGASYELELDRCYQVDVSGGAAINNSASVDDEYGMIISNCHRVTVTGGGHAATRHAIAIGGGSGTGAVPCRDIVINNMTLINTAADIGAADMHGNCDRVAYNNCVINTHAHMAGRNVAYRNCTIYGRTSASDRTCIYGSEIAGGTFEIDTCTLITSGDLNTFGAIHLAATQVLNEHLNIIVRNLTVKGGAGGSLAKLVRVSVASGETKKCNVDIRGVRCELTEAQCVLYIRCEPNTAQTIVSDGHIVDDVYGPDGMGLIFATGAALTGIPTREMTQQGWVDFVSVASQINAAPSQTFRYPYSKVPNCPSPSISSPTGADQSLIGTIVPVPKLYAVTATTIRPAMLAPSGTFAAGTTVRFGWQAGIRDI